MPLLLNVLVCTVPDGLDISYLLSLRAEDHSLLKQDSWRPDICCQARTLQHLGEHVTPVATLHITADGASHNVLTL